MTRKIIPDVIEQKHVETVRGKTSARRAAQIMREHDVGALPIVEGGTLKGIITVNDMACRVVAAGLDPDETPVKDVMTPDPDTVGPDTSAIDALRLMQDGGYRHLPVVSGGRVCGLLSRRDFFGLEKARLDEETKLWERIG